MLPELAGPEIGWLSSEEELAGRPLRNWSVMSPAGPGRRAPARAQAYSLEEAAAVPDGVGAQGMPERLLGGSARPSADPQCSSRACGASSHRVKPSFFSLLGLPGGKG